jgi:hypothetical protein
MVDATRGRREREKRRLEASATKGELVGPDPSVALRIKRGPPPLGRRAGGMTASSGSKTPT